MDDSEKVILNITYIPLQEGEVTIEVEKLSYKTSKYKGKTVVDTAEALTVNVVNSYDYSTFLTLAGKFNEDNLLSKLSEFRSCLNEMKNFDASLAKDEEVINAIAKVNKCIQKYEQIQEYLDKLNTSSSTVGNLIGGK